MIRHDEEGFTYERRSSRHHAFSIRIVILAKCLLGVILVSLNQLLHNEGVLDLTFLIGVDQGFRGDFGRLLLGPLDFAILILLGEVATEIRLNVHIVVCRSFRLGLGSFLG